MYSGRPLPESIISCIFACAMSRATMMVPVKARRVETGSLSKNFRFSSIGLFRSTFAISPPFSKDCSVMSGRYFAGSVSSFSRKTPSSLIFALACRSAEQDTPMPTGQEAPCRGSRTTRTSCRKYFPPNCAPMPSSWEIFLIFSSQSKSRKARPMALPDTGSPSRYLQLASFTVFKFCSADRPPTTKAKWYGGQAAVPMPFTISATNSAKALSLRTPLVFCSSWVLLALPPPFAMYSTS
mmetsp:Transcript_73633/g.175583  ORF Transcript_73633/g.175583 Transcript_73633/m.175583 type:complete len:239 (+) Transcript_73633:56-772(+)